jgi:hypothetical protein
MMNRKGFGRKWSYPIFRYYPRICLEGLRKATKKSFRISGLRAEISRIRSRNVNHSTTMFGHFGQSLWNAVEMKMQGWGHNDISDMIRTYNLSK